ncbi:putative mannose-6-phosphate class i [Phaeomoniella chlamydospora]|uniref:Mannose-6-phosphate isomerase n=1 Tax=Phaeomoniella chlamydospora TaxID=158046 RepID=A0A0G2GIR3_PHACM|nr:putative mannose-6-phosphate class i [Phaeomoniella chlamydospora]
MQVPLIRLQCGVNTYDWGKKGKDSAAAKYAATTASTDFSIQEDKPYAELWMGTHPSLPSKDVTTGRSLLDLVSDNQALMGQEITSKYSSKLPFLFKVLSISKALSIQAHPNKKLAEKLHENDPRNYPDDNHKPEMTIAITPFEGLCGFRPLEQIAHFLRTVQPLKVLVGDEQALGLEQTAADEASDLVSSKSSLRSAFTHLLKSNKEDVAAMSKELVQLAEEGKIEPPPDSNITTSELTELIVRLNGQFPGDIGLFVMFFLNYVRLSPGEAMFLKADDIHAYISGDIIECMASSDNVIRAGFTPKFQDVNTLTEILTYDHDPPEKQKLETSPWPYVKFDRPAYSAGSECLLYDPPIEEFSVLKTDLSKGKATFDPINGPSIIICTSGSGKISVGPKTEDFQEGWVYFVGATAEAVLQTDGDMVTYRAFCDTDGTVESPQANGH